MKIYLLVILLITHHVYARVPIEDLKKIEKNIEIQTLNENFVINPDGPLNPVFGYMYLKSGFLRKQQLLVLKRNSDYSTKNALITPEDKYASEYCNAFAQMFSLDTDISSDRAVNTSAFTRFLNTDGVKKHKYDILAGLLLLSERINVCLEWKEEKNAAEISLDEKARKKEYFFLLNIDKCLSNETTKAEKNAIKCLINFFTNYKNSKEEKPLTIEELKKEELLNSPQFLIQAYIFDYIETAEDAKELVDAVYTILTDSLMRERQLNPTNSVKKYSADPVFKKFFVLSTCTKRISYSDVLEKLSSSIKKNQSSDIKDIYVFYHATMDYYNPSVRKTFEEKNYNIVLKRLYFLFCSMLYNPCTQRYSKSEATKMSPLLSTFFTSHNDPYEDIDSSILWKDWATIFTTPNPQDNNKSVQDCIPVVYKENRKDPEFGMLKLLSLIGKITGRSDICNTASQFIAQLKGVKTLTDSFCERLEQCFEETFRSLSRNKDVTVLCFDLKQGYSPDNEPDVFGQIYIEYTFKNKMYNGVMPFCQKSVVDIDGPDFIAYKYIDKSTIMKEKLERKSTFMGRLVTDYINP